MLTEDSKPTLTEDRKSQILERLRQQREIRRNQMAKGQEQYSSKINEILNYDISGNNKINSGLSNLNNQEKIASKESIINRILAERNKNQKEENFTNQQQIDDNNYDWEDIVNRENGQKNGNQQIKGSFYNGNLNRISQHSNSSNQMMNLDQVQNRINFHIKKNSEMKSKFEQSFRSLSEKSQRSPNKYQQEQQFHDGMMPVRDYSISKIVQRQKADQAMSRSAFSDIQNRQKFEGKENFNSVQSKNRFMSAMVSDNQVKTVKTVSSSPQNTDSGRNDQNYNNITALSKISQNNLEYFDTILDKYNKKSYRGNLLSTGLSVLSRRTQEEYVRNKQIQPKPDIHDLPRDIYKNNARNQLDISKQEQWERILYGKVQVAQQREMKNLEQQKQQIQTSCTFQPHINEISQILAKNREMEESIDERLYREGMEKIRNKDRLKREVQDQVNYPFRPDIEASLMALKGEHAFQRPLYQRVDEVVQKKNEDLIQLKTAHSEQNMCTFKPKINEQSTEIAQRKNGFDNADIMERMMKDVYQKVERKLKQRQNTQSELSRICTFHPSVGSTSFRGGDEILARDGGSIQDFVNRQVLVADEIKQKIEKKANEHYTTGDYTFKPKINKLSEYLIEADTERNQENLDERINRLAVKDWEKKEIVREQLQKAYYDKFTFKPQINEISSGLVRRRSVGEFADQKETIENLKKKKLEAEREKLKECSFKPNVLKKQKFNHVEPRYVAEKVGDSLKQDVEKQNKIIEKLKKEQQYNELKECSFKPQVNQKEGQGASEKQLNTHVRGMDGFLKLKEMKQKQQEDQQRREEEVFNIQHKYDLKQHQTHTVPSPFKLSKVKHLINYQNQNPIFQKNNPRQMKELRDEIYSKEQEECTFKPQTNEGKNKELIKQILSDDD